MSLAARRLFADTTALQNPDSRRLWVSGIVTVIGANLTIFAVPVQIYRQGLAVIVAVVGWGTAMVGFGLVSGVAHRRAGRLLLAATVFLALGGGADMVSDAFRSTILQQVASDDLRGRLQGVFIVVVAGGPRLADAVHGAAAASWGTVVAVIGGGGLVVVSVLVARFAAPALVRYRAPTPAARQLQRRVG